jgi:hypothetical protein
MAEVIENESRSAYRTERIGLFGIERLRGRYDVTRVCQNELIAQVGSGNLQKEKEEH